MPSGSGLMYKLQEGSGKQKGSDNLQRRVLVPILYPTILSIAFFASSEFANLTNLQ